MSDAKSGSDSDLDRMYEVGMRVSIDAREDPLAVVFLFVDRDEAVLLSRKQAEMAMKRLGKADRIALLNYCPNPCVEVYADGSVKVGTVTMVSESMTQGGEC